MISWVVFDLGDVVLVRTAALPDVAALLRVPVGDLEAAYWRHRRDYDLRSDATSFWTQVAGTSGAAPPDVALIAELVRVDDLGWSNTNADVLQLIADLAAAGVALAVLSNAPASLGEVVRGQDWAGVFRHMLFSGELHLLKPEAPIYAALLARLGQCPPEEVAFLDDRADNVAGAAALGITAVMFTSAAQARSDLRALGLPV